MLLFRNLLILKYLYIVNYYFVDIFFFLLLDEFFFDWGIPAEPRRLENMNFFKNDTIILLIFKYYDNSRIFFVERNLEELEAIVDIDHNYIELEKDIYVEDYEVNAKKYNI
jgi:hypothetical protein